MYVVKQKKHIVEELRLQNERETLDLKVDLWIDDVFHKYNKIRLMLGEAQHDLQENPTSEKAQASYGSVLVAFFSLIFGAENTEKMLQFYDGRYSDLLEDVAPFIVDVIQPQVQAAAQEKVKNLRNMAKRARR